MSIEEGKIFFIIIKAFWGDVLQTAPTLPCSHKPLSKSFRPPFSKGGAGGGRGALLALHRARNNPRRFFFDNFFLCAFGFKEKSGWGVCSNKGETPLVVSPLFSSKKFTPSGAYERSGVSRSAEREEGFAPSTAKTF